MNDVNQIPAEWLLYNLSFKLFARFEKKIGETLENKISFISLDSIKEAQKISDALNNTTSADVLNKVPGQDQVIIIKLAGNFYSTDVLVFEGLFVNTNRLNIQLKYVRSESFDGEPFEVDAFILIPTPYSFNNIFINFSCFRKNFYSNAEQRADDINIPNIEINF